jgi:transmembrane protein TMEM260 (protein O-mannosyltransferase)
MTISPPKASARTFDPGSLAPWLIAGLAALVYVALCAPVSGMGDSSELTLVLATFGVAHPTGYPLYTIFGHAFCVALHALGFGWSLAAALWSVVGAVLAFWFLGALAREWVERVPGATPALRACAPLVPLGVLLVQPVVLGEATRAEINIWSLAWAAGAAFAFVRLAPLIERDARDPAALRRHAALWGLVCGLGLAHHLTSVLISAPLSAGLLVILVRHRALAPAQIGIALAALVLPWSSDLFVAWRAWHPARYGWPMLEPSLRGVLEHLTAHQYRLYLGYFAPSEQQKELLARTVYPILGPGLMLLILGLVRARQFEARVSWAAVLAAACAVTAFTFRYGVDDPAPYFLAPMALGVAAAAPALASIPGAGSRAGLAGLAVLALASSLVIVPWAKGAVERRSIALSYERVIRSMWSSIPPDTAIVSWNDDRFNRLLEYQILRGEKPALLIVNPDVLLSGKIRREVLRRFGADPREGFRPSPYRSGTETESEYIAAARQDLVRRLNERVRVPVILFDPSVPIVWQYRKPWEPRGAEPPRPASPHALPMGRPAKVHP